MSYWSFEPVLDSYAVVAIISIALMVIVLLVRPWIAGDSRRTWILISIRIAVIGLLVLAMLRPARVSSEQQSQSATLVLLYDQSRSMSIKDLEGNRSRWQHLTRVLQNVQPELDSLSEILDVPIYSFDRELSSASQHPSDLRLPVKPTGEETDLAIALRDVLQAEAGKRLAGVVLFSDGSQRVAQPRLGLQQAVRDLTRTQVPLYTVAFGKPRDQSQARDVAIEQLRDQYTVFVKNELEIRGAIRVQGYVNRPIPIKVDVVGPTDARRMTLGPYIARATEDGERVAFQFAFVPDIAGAYTLKVYAEPQEGELVVSNNEMNVYVNVLDGGIRILYLEGNLLGPEQQVLRRSLAQSPDIELYYRPIDPRRSASWPIDLRPEMEGRPFDVLLIGDVDASALGDQNLKWIADLVVEQGRGLMMIGGVNTFGPGGYRGTPLDVVLPIELGQFNRQEFGADKAVRADVHLPDPVQMVPTPNRPHFVTQLSSSDQNRDAWLKLKPLQGANRFFGLRTNAIRMAESTDGEPLLVGREFAPGRVLVFAGDTTHRWYRWGQQEAHKRFWRQAMLWLANKDELLRRDVWIQLDRRRFRPGEPIVFRGGARSETGEVLPDVTFSAELESKGEASTAAKISMAESGDEWIGQTDAPSTAGEYILRLVATQDDVEVGKAVARFQVEQVDLELADPAANPQRLAMLAEMTKQAGGRVVPPEQLNDFIKEIRERPPETKLEVQSKWRFGDTSADTWPFFAIFVGLMASDWYLRKKWGAA